MNIKKLFGVITLAICSLIFTFGLSACSQSELTNKTITISIQPNAEIGTNVILEKEANFSPFYQNNIQYEFIGDNSCEATFTHTFKNNWYTTYVSANTPGTVSIKLTYLTDDNTIVAESNVVTITFYGNYIETVDDLKSIAGSNKNYILGADIDLSSESNWTSISNFTGILDGNGYSITNLTINSVNDENLGLFSNLQGTVKNLKIENANITSRGDAGKAGIVAGSNAGVIENVEVSGNITANYYDNVGGIVGYNDNGMIFNCKNQATIKANNNVGGIAGYLIVNDNNKADNNINNGIIEGNTNVGGIVGYATASTKKTSYNFTYKISNNTNDGTINGTSNVGGVIGSLIGANKWSSSYVGLGYFDVSIFTNNGDVKASTGDFTGGIIGYAERLNEISVCQNNANITGNNYVGGYIGKSSNTIIKNAINNNVITGKGYVGGIAGYANAIIKSKNTKDIIVNNAGSYVGGLVGYLSVNDDDQLNDNENLGYIQGKDYVGGIVGYATASTKKTSYNFTYKISNNTNSGTINGTSNVGGIIGSLVGANKWSSSYVGLGYFNVSLCNNNAEINATGNNVGGIIGNATRLETMTVCENNADVMGNNYVGGYVGNGIGANIKLATNNNTITGNGYVGGIAGIAGKIEISTNNGVINSTGIIVEDSTSMAYVGGIVGYCNSLINSTNNSDINISTGGQYVGGLAGYILFSSDNQINDNQNYGKVTGSKYTGGIAGYIQSTIVKSSNNYTRSVGKNKNYGSINGTDYVAGIFGYVYSAGKYSSSYSGVCYIILTYCENQAEISGSSFVGGIVGGYTRLTTDSDIMDTNTTLYGDKLGKENN